MYHFKKQRGLKLAGNAELLQTILRRGFFVPVKRHPVRRVACSPTYPVGVLRVRGESLRGAVKARYLQRLTALDLGDATKLNHATVAPVVQDWGG